MWCTSLTIWLYFRFSLIHSIHIVLYSKIIHAGLNMYIPQTFWLDIWLPFLSKLVKFIQIGWFPDMDLTFKHRFSVVLKLELWDIHSRNVMLDCITYFKTSFDVLLEHPNVFKFHPSRFWIEVKLKNLGVVLLLHYSIHFVQCTSKTFL